MTGIDQAVQIAAIGIVLDKHDAHLTRPVRAAQTLCGVRVAEAVAIAISIPERAAVGALRIVVAGPARGAALVDAADKLLANTVIENYAYELSQ